MYITEIEITNIRSFKGTHRVSLQHTDGSYAGWTVIAGRNGSGKSTLLKAIALAVVGPDAARALVWDGSGWKRQGENECSVIANCKYEHFIVNNPYGPGYVRAVPEHGKSGPAAFRIDSDSGKFGSNMIFNNQIGEDFIDLYGENLFSKYYNAIIGYGAFRHIGALTVEAAQLSNDPVLSRMVSLFREGSSLVEAVNWLKNQHYRSLDKGGYQKKLLADVISILDDGLLPDASRISGIDSDGLWVTQNGLNVCINQISDGYRSVAALVVDLLRHLNVASEGDLRVLRDDDGSVICDLPGVVLIDEIDAHMHVEWQQRIGFWLTKHFPKIQFIVTTHSPFICQAASPGGIIRLPAPGEDRTIEQVSEETWRTIVNGGADAAVMTELFGLEHARSDPAEARVRRLAALERKVLTNTASDAELAAYDRLQAETVGDLATAAEVKLRAVTEKP